jgi:prepilin-type N-terminal cleavage/methylation domain-containing protein
MFSEFLKELKMKEDKKKRVFTLIELMVVIMIVAIFAAVTVPILRGRIKQAKWSEESQQIAPEESQEEICKEQQSFILNIAPEEVKQ